MEYIIKYKEGGEDKFSFASSKTDLENKIIDKEVVEIRHNNLTFSDYLKSQPTGIALSPLAPSLYFSDSQPIVDMGQSIEE